LRDNKGGQSNHSNTGVYNNRNGQPNNFRGRGSSYGANRGNMNNSGGGGFNRNFSGPQMGGMAGGFQPAMGGFQGGQMGGQMGGQFGGFNRGGMMNGMRGGPGGMRGGRGGMGNGMMGGIPMGGIPMGAMAGMAPPMGMGQMGGGMPGKTNPRPHPSYASLHDMDSLSWVIDPDKFSYQPNSACISKLFFSELRMDVINRGAYPLSILL
jgi:hypothetical protein